MAREGLVDSSGGSSLHGMLKTLLAKKVISAKVYKTAHELRMLGNKVAHEDAFPSVEAARDYVNAVNSLITLLIQPRSS
jgi:hypothetical protein